MSIVHVCAAKEDDAILKLLIKQLHALGVVTHAGEIPVGANVNEHRVALLTQADAIVLLISADFNACSKCAEDVQLALLLKEQTGKLVVPVLGRPCVWDTQPYARLQRPRSNDKPLCEGGEVRDDALSNFVKELRSLLPQRSLQSNVECPFPGLESFKEADAPHFYGREAEINEAFAKLKEGHRWLQIDGASGAGKSSFARAGICPAVRAGRLVDGPSAWIVAVLRPGHDPIANLAEALMLQATPLFQRHDRSLDAITRELRESPTALKSLLREGRAEGHGVLLLVDQLEEIFTLAGPDRTAVTQFDALLAHALDDSDVPLLLVSTIRSDFVGRMGELPELERRLSTDAGRYYLRSMSPAGLRSAIERPAEGAGLTFEAGLVDRLVSDAAMSPGALPLVAHVLRVLYAERDGRTLTTRVYLAIGGLGGALTKIADAIVDTLGSDSEPRAKSLLLRLIRIGRGLEDTRQSAQREVALSAAGGGEEAERVLAWLSGGLAKGRPPTNAALARLIVVSGEAGPKRVDLVHEALIHKWERLKDWIKEERQQLELRDDVEDAARIWEKNGSHDDWLPKGPALARFCQINRSGLQTWARLFLERAEEAEARAEEEKRKSEARRARNQRFIMLGLLGFVLGLGALSAGLAWQIGRAREEASRARRAERVTQQAERVNRGARVRLLAEQGGAEIEALGAAIDVVAGDGNPDGAPPAAVEALTTAVLAERQGRALGEHEGNVVAVVYSPDSSRIATADDVGSVRIWDSHTGERLLSLPIDTGNVVALAFAADGSHLLTAVEGGSAMVWSARDGAPIVAVDMYSYVSAAAISADGKILAVADGELTGADVYLWDVSERRPFFALGGHGSPVETIAFSTDGSHLVTASRDGSSRLWTLGALDAEPVVLSLEGEGRGGGVLYGGSRDMLWSKHTASFSPDGARIITAGTNSNAHIWDVETGRLVRTLEGTSKASFSPDGSKVVGVSLNNSAGIWDTERWTLLTTLRGHAEFVLSAAFSPDGKRVVTTSNDRTAVLWNAERGTPIKTLHGHRTAVRIAVFSPDGAQVASAGDEPSARVWNLNDTTPLRSLAPCDGSTVAFLRGNSTYAYVRKGVAVAALSPDGRRALTVCAPGKSAQIWSVAEGRVTTTLPWDGGGIVDSPGFSGNGLRALTIHDGMTVLAWDTESGAQLAMWSRRNANVPTDSPAPDLEVLTAAFSPDSERVSIVYKDGLLTVIDMAACSAGWEIRIPAEQKVQAATWVDHGELRVIASHRQEKSLHVHTLNVEQRSHRVAVAHTPASSDTVWVSGNGNWALVPGLREAELYGVSPFLREARAAWVQTDVRSVKVSGDGVRAVLVDRRGFAELHNIRTGESIGILRGHASPVDVVQFSSDSLRVLTASTDGSVRLWDAQTGEPLATLIAYGAFITTASFSKNGRYVVAGSDEGKVQIFPAGTEDFLTLACQALRYRPELHGVLGPCAGRAERSLD